MLIYPLHVSASLLNLASREITCVSWVSRYNPKVTVVVRLPLDKAGPNIFDSLSPIKIVCPFTNLNIKIVKILAEQNLNPSTNIIK